MKKIGVCVNYNVNNYGSMLQLLATQNAINNCGVEYEFIRYNKKTIGFMIKNIPRLFNPYYMRGVRMDLKKNYYFRKNKNAYEGNQIRLGFFRKYRKNHFKSFSEEYKGYKNLVEGAKKYDAVLVGSDQLWTPAGILSRFYNLLFVPENVRKISYATSFGVNSIPENQRALTREYLNRIDDLSVREEKGKEIVERLTGRKDCMVALDPTLLFSGEEWEKMIPYKRIVEEPYIFCYFLGTNAEHRKTAKELQKKTGYKIITTPHLDDFVAIDESFGDDRMYNAGPEEFLNLIRGAEYICTDSFHGSIFSILNHKKFATFNRFNNSDKQSRNSRIDSLFNILGLNERRYKADIYETIKKDIDYDSVELNLEKARKESLDFLGNALK